jgi:hypothetical protein
MTGAIISLVRRFDILFQARFCKETKALLRAGSPLDHRPGRSPLATTILFIPLSAAQHNLESDWAAAAEEVILRQCRCVCRTPSSATVGGANRHDEDHDWIGIRRGVCHLCGKTFTFLPLFSPPYTHYSLIARSQALRRYFLEGCSWETAAPSVRDPDRVARITVGKLLTDSQANNPPLDAAANGEETPRRYRGRRG